MRSLTLSTDYTDEEKTLCNLWIRLRDECSLSPNRLHSLRLRTNRGLRHLRCYPEDAPDSAIELKRFLSPIQIVARHSSGPTSTIRWNHFVVRGRSDAVYRTFHFRQRIVANRF